jgi:hypothetical protein
MPLKGDVMATAEYVVMPESADQEAKPKFNAYSFDGLIRRINNNPNLLQGDWRYLVRNEFRLTAEQEQSLVRVAENRVKEIQSCLTRFAQMISQGATISGRIIKRPIEEQTPEAVHGVQIELQLPELILQAFNTPRMLRIAHCDANCENWEWDSW